MLTLRDDENPTPAIPPSKSWADPAAAQRGRHRSRALPRSADQAPGARASSRASRLLARHGRKALAALAVLALLPYAFAAALVHRLYFDRSGLPDIDAFIRFETPTTGHVRDSRGQVLIELAREYRRVVTYDEVPLVLRQAILATEDKNFFSHDGVEYRSLPRVLGKAVSHTRASSTSATGATGSPPRRTTTSPSRSAPIRPRTPARRPCSPASPSRPATTPRRRTTRWRSSAATRSSR